MKYTLLRHILSILCILTNSAYAAEQSPISTAGASGRSMISPFVGTQDTTPLHVAVHTNDLTRVKSLIYDGAALNFKDTQGNTPLLLATRQGSFSVVRALLKAPIPADPNIANLQGETPLIEAAKLGHRKIIEQFSLIPKLCVNHKDKTGRNALHHALEHPTQEIGRIVSILSQKGITQDDRTQTLVDALQNTRDLVRQLLSSYIDAQDTPLHIAIRTNHLAKVKSLIDKGDPLNIKDAQGNTPLLLATRQGLLSVVRALLQAPNPADPNIANLQGETPLIEAAKLGHRKIIDQLTLIPSLRICQRDRTGKNALHHTLEHPTREIVPIIRRLHQYGIGTDARAKKLITRIPNIRDAIQGIFEEELKRDASTQTELIDQQIQDSVADPASPNLSPISSSSTVVHNHYGDVVHHGNVTEHVDKRQRHWKLLCCVGCCKRCNEPCKDLKCRVGCNPC